MITVNISSLNLLLGTLPLQFFFSVSLFHSRLPPFFGLCQQFISNSRNLSLPSSVFLNGRDWILSYDKLFMFITLFSFSVSLPFFFFLSYYPFLGFFAFTFIPKLCSFYSLPSDDIVSCLSVLLLFIFLFISFVYFFKSSLFLIHTSECSFFYVNVTCTVYVTLFISIQTQWSMFSRFT